MEEADVTPFREEQAIEVKFMGPILGDGLFAGSIAVIEVDDVRIVEERAQSGQGRIAGAGIFFSLSLGAINEEAIDAVLPEGVPDGIAIIPIPGMALVGVGSHGGMDKRKAIRGEAEGFSLRLDNRLPFRVVIDGEEPAAGALEEQADVEGGNSAAQFDNGGMLMQLDFLQKDQNGGRPESGTGPREKALPWKGGEPLQGNDILHAMVEGHAHGLRGLGLLEQIFPWR